MAFVECIYFLKRAPYYTIWIVLEHALCLNLRNSSIKPTTLLKQMVTGKAPAALIGKIALNPMSTFKGRQTLQWGKWVACLAKKGGKKRKKKKKTAICIFLLKSN